MKRNVPPNLRKAVIDIWGGKCAITGINPTDYGITIEVDHIIPISSEGNNNPSNLIPILSKLNKIKSKNRYPKPLEIFMLQQATRVAPKVHDKWSRLSHKSLVFPVKLEKTNLEKALKVLKATVKWSLEDTLTLVKNWIEYGIHGLQATANEIDRTLRSAIQKLSNLGIYQKNYEGRKLVLV